MELHELLRRSDVVSLHLPLTARTRRVIGERELALMPPHAVLVNTSRGGLIDEAALAARLADGALRAAALDVFEDEPPKLGLLRGLPNVVLTPHVGGLSEASVAHMTEQATGHVLAALGGRPPLGAWPTRTCSRRRGDDGARGPLALLRRGGGRGPAGRRDGAGGRARGRRGRGRGDRRHAGAPALGDPRARPPPRSTPTPASWPGRSPPSRASTSPRRPPRPSRIAGHRAAVRRGGAPDRRRGAADGRRRGRRRALGYTLPRPTGVVAAITPFNYPAILVIHKIGPALAAGNPVVLKPASATPLTARFLVERLAGAGLPDGALQLVAGPGRELGAALCADPRVRKISFTGSYEAGAAIASAAGVKRLTCELGSNAALVVLEDADLDRAAGAIAFSGFTNAGQNCVSTQRVLVDERVADDLLARLLPRVDALVPGDPAQPSTSLSPVIDERSADRVVRWLAEAREAGGQVVRGGDRDGAVVEPGVVLDPPADSRLWREELFGPAVAIRTFAGDDEALAGANSTRYGLAMSVMTRDLDRALRFARGLRAGIVNVNPPRGSTWRADHMPWGGLADSGFGKEGVRYAVRDSLEDRLVVDPSGRCRDDAARHGPLDRRPRDGGAGRAGLRRAWIDLEHGALSARDAQVAGAGGPEHGRAGVRARSLLPERRAGRGARRRRRRRRRAVGRLGRRGARGDPQAELPAGRRARLRPPPRRLVRPGARLRVLGRGEAVVRRADRDAGGRRARRRRSPRCPASTPGARLRRPRGVARHRPPARRSRSSPRRPSAVADAAAARRASRSASPAAGPARQLASLAAGRADVVSGQRRRAALRRRRRRRRPTRSGGALEAVRAPA